MASSTGFLRSLKVFLLFSAMVLPCAGFSEAKTFQYLDQTYKLYVNPSKVLFLYGPWGDDPVIVDRPVREGWGRASSLGIAVVYQRRDELRWAIMNREDGKKVVWGILRNLEPEAGVIDYVAFTSQDDKASAKVVFESGNFTVYQFDKFGRQKVVREGKVDKR